MVSETIAELRITIGINILTGNITIKHFGIIFMYYMKFKFFHDNAATQDAITTSHNRYTILKLNTIIWVQINQLYAASFNKNSSTNVFYISALLI